MALVNKPELTGGSWGINDIAVSNMISNIDPTYIVDFGCGLGKYSDMCKATLKHPYDIIGIDGFQPTIDYLKQTDKYRDTIYGLIENEVNNFNGDLAIFGDVLEHLPKQTSFNIIDKAIETFKYVIIVIPLHDYPQGPSGGNVLEEHICSFEEYDFDRYNIIEKHIKSERSTDRTVTKMAILIKHNYTH